MSLEIGFYLRRVTVELAKLEKARRKYRHDSLGEACAFVRTSARSSLRRRKKPSSPGSPPSVHSRDRFANLRNILFAIEDRDQSAVIGPARANQVNITLTGNRTVPEIQEHGATVDILERRINNATSSTAEFQQWAARVGYKNEWTRVDLRRTARLDEEKRYERRTRRATYQPRPFMRPALENNKSQIRDAFRGGLTRAA